MEWSKECEQEDEASQVSKVKVTQDILGGMMDELIPGLNFTTENCEDFETKWLPTLDVQIQMEKQQNVVNWVQKIIRYKFYQNQWPM